MSEEVQRRLALAVKAIQHLCRLDVQAWTTRDRMFGPGEKEWPDRILSKLIAEHMVDTGVRRADAVILYRVSQANRQKALALFTGLAAEPTLLSKLVDPDRTSIPPRHTIVPPPPDPITATRKNPLLQAQPRVMIEVSAKLYENIKVRAASRGLSVKAYLLDVLAADGVQQD
jgi:hypothetical protein